MKRNLIRGNIRCSSKYQIGNVITVDGFRTIGDSMCESFCNNKDYCQFISVNNNNECRLYTSCDHSEKSYREEIVYEKHNHGNQFDKIFLVVSKELFASYYKNLSDNLQSPLFPLV